METNPNHKRVYLVRHGQTVANISGAVQGLADPLTEAGEEQARILAERFRLIPFDVLYASDAIRAHETARRIGDATGHAIQSTPLLREVPYPTSLVGLQKTEASVAAYLVEQYCLREDSTWKYEDEESFSELCLRADAVLEIFENESAATITAVTHGHFLKIIIGRLLLGEAFTVSDWHRLVTFLSMSNTGITMLDFDGTKWRMLTWNDHAHLG